MKIREEYERKARMRRENEIESLVKSRGEVAVTLNAVSVFQENHKHNMSSIGIHDDDDDGDHVTSNHSLGQQQQGFLETFVDRVSRVKMIHAVVKHVWEVSFKL